MKEKFALNIPSTSSGALATKPRPLTTPTKPVTVKGGSESDEDHRSLHAENAVLNTVLGTGGGGGGSNSSRSPSINSASYFQMLKYASIEEHDGIRNSGTVTVYFQTTKHKKTYFAVLTERTFELHESEKTHRKKKSAKYIVDLSTCFNISQQNFSKFRNFVSLMTPDETLLFKGEKESDSEKWYSKILEAVIPARAIHLGRPVFATEFFESAWDVVLKANPRLKNAKPDPANLPNICARRPELAEQKRRLCIYPHAIILCEFGIGPSLKGAPNSSIPPFKTSNFIEFSRAYVKDFGSHDKYFFLRFGRSSEIGACEVWMQCTAPACDSEESAAEIYTKIKNIIDRENEKQRKGMDAAFPALACNNSLPSSSARRHTARKSTKSGGSASAAPIATTGSRASEKGALPTSSSLTHSGYGNPTSSFSHYYDQPQPGQPHSMRQKRTPTDETLENGIQERSSNRCYCRELASSSFILEPPGGGVDDETEDSGGTLRVSCENCENCRADSPPAGLDAYDNDGGETASYGSSSHRNATMSVEDLSEVGSPKHAIETDEKHGAYFPERRTSRDTSIERLKYSEHAANVEDLQSSSARTREDSLRKSVSLCLEATSGESSRTACGESGETDIGGRKASSSMLCLTDQTSTSYANDPVTAAVSAANTTSSASSASSSSSYRVAMANPTASEGGGECSSENMSTSSSISTGGHLSSSFSTDASTSSVHSYNGAGLRCQPPPYHPRTMSCSAGTYGVRTGLSGGGAGGGRVSAVEASLAETAARSAFYKMQQKKRRPIAEECAISSSGENAESSLGSIVDQASCSSAGSVPFLSVPLHYDNHMLASSCIDETCSYASDSADSCYSSITNGNLDPRTFSFSSDIPRPNLNYGGYPTVTENEVIHHYNNRPHSDQPNANYEEGSQPPSLRGETERKSGGNASPRSRASRNSSVLATSGQQTRAADDEEIELLESTIICPLPQKSSHHTSPKSVLSCHSAGPCPPSSTSSQTDDSRRRTFSLGNTSWLAKKLLPRKLSSNANRIAKNATSKSDRAIRSSKDEIELQMRPMLGDIAFPAWSYSSSPIQPSSTSLHAPPPPPAHTARSVGGPRDEGRRLSWRSVDDHGQQPGGGAATARDTISPSPSLTASSSSMVRANSMSSQRTGLSGGRSSFCMTPSASLAGFSTASDNFNKYSSEDYVDETDLKRTTAAHRPEKSRAINQKLVPGQCYTSTEDYAMLDDIMSNRHSGDTSNAPNKAKSPVNNVKVKGAKKKLRSRVNVAGLSGVAAGNNIVQPSFATIDENVSGRNSPSIDNKDSKGTKFAISKTQQSAELTKITTTNSAIVTTVTTKQTTSTVMAKGMETLIEPKKEDNEYVAISCPSNDKN